MSQFSPDSELETAEAPVARPRPPVIDWTLTPAKTGAVGILALLGSMGLAWSIIRAESRPAPAQIATPPAHVAANAHTPLDPAATAQSPPPTLVSEPVPFLAAPLDTIAEAPTPTAATPSTAPPPSPDPVVIVENPTPADPSPQPDPAIAQRININTASVEELQLLPGIGPSRAAAIIADRQANGPFRSIDDLERVRGIGPGIVNGLREFARTR